MDGRLTNLLQVFGSEVSEHVHLTLAEEENSVCEILSVDIVVAFKESLVSSTGIFCCKTSLVEEGCRDEADESKAAFGERNDD